jgi:predicted hotdog family 3-hydroxylacyl-ACP dehydratase
MRLDRDWIAAHLPHQGHMCLLDEVLSWDPQQLQCRTGTHRRADHPLRMHGRLGGACAIEYAAQAAALHGALLVPRAVLHTAGRTGADAAAGMNVGVSLLAGARAIELAVERLDDIAADLLVGVVRLYADARSALYSFELRQADAGAARRLAHGRLSLWLPAP